MSLQEIVNVSITRETKSVSQVGFGTALILGSNLNSTNRVESVTAADSALAALLCGGSASPEYKAVQAAFAQNPRPVSVKIGQRTGSKVITDNAGTFTAGSIVSVVNGTTVTTAWGTAKDTTLTAHATAIALIAGVDTAVYSSGARTITVTADAGAPLSLTTSVAGITGTMTVAITATASETHTDALNAIVLVDNDWYGLCLTSRTKSEQEEVALWTESQKKVLALASAETIIASTTNAADTTSLAAVLKAAGYTRTVLVYLTSSATQYPDAAFLGRILPLDPGTYTAKFKNLNSITVDSLTNTQSTNIRAKYANSYEEIGGVSMIQEGKTSSGEFIDIIVFGDWMTSRITEGVFRVLATSNRVPFTEAGAASIKGEIEKVLKIGQGRQAITPYGEDDNKSQNGGYVVTLPNFDLITQNDKALRTLSGVEFTAWLAGAIHAVTINGIVTL